MLSIVPSLKHESCANDDKMTSDHEHDLLTPLTSSRIKHRETTIALQILSMT